MLKTAYTGLKDFSPAPPPDFLYTFYLPRAPFLVLWLENWEFSLSVVSYIFCDRIHFLGKMVREENNKNSLSLQMIVSFLVLSQRNFVIELRCLLGGS